MWEIRAALRSQLDELDTWAPVAEAADGTPEARYVTDDDKVERGRH